MQHRSKKLNQLGAALLEVIVAVGIVTLVMTTIVSLVTVSLKSASIAQSKTLGTKYSQEGLESLRQMRNVLGWDTFLATLQADGTSIHYCLTSVPTTGPEFAALQNASCSDTQFVDAKNLFQRQADIVITTNGTRTSVAVTIRTTWNDSGIQKQSVVSQQFEEYNTADAPAPVIYSPLPYGYGATPLPSPSPTPPPGAAVYWNFDEGSGSTANDSIGSNDGSLKNGPKWAAGVTGSAVTFDGSNDYMQAQSMTLDETSFSISAWFKSTSAGDVKIISFSSKDHPLQLYNGMLRACTNGHCLAGTTVVKDGNWHFATVTGSGTTVTLYLDGQLEASFTSPNIVITAAPTIASIFGGGNFSFPGTLDEVQIYNYALSAAQVNAIYTSDTGWQYRAQVPIDNGSSTAQSNYQVPVLMNTATLITAGKMKAACADLRFSADGVTALPFWIEPGTCNTVSTKIWIKTNLAATAPSLYAYYGNTFASATTYTTANVFLREIPNVVAAYNFDETWSNNCSTTSVVDSSGGGHNAVSCPPGAGTTGGAAGYAGTGALLNGTSQYLRAAKGSYNAFGTGNFTATGWIKTTSIGAQESMLGTASSSQGWRFGINGGQLYYLYGDGPHYKEGNFPTPVLVTNGAWHYLLVIYVRGAVYGYVDGVSVGAVDTSQVTGSVTNALNLWMGSFNGGLGFVSGTMDDLRIYSRALTLAELTDVYQGGAGEGYVTSNYPGIELVRKYLKSITVNALGTEQPGSWSGL